MDPINTASRMYRGANALSKGKFFQSLGSFFNMGKWAENAAAGFGGNVRNAATYGPDVVKTPAVAGVPARWDMMKLQMIPEVPAVPAVMERGAMLADETRTGLGYGATALGNLGVYGGGATLGYKMFGGGNGEPQAKHDANGTSMKGYNEELGKARSEFQIKKLAGSKEFSKEKYAHLRSQTGWVDTAIGELGKAKYMQYRDALMRGEMNGQQMHDVLTSALASVGDEEALKEAAKEPYVLPGIARNSDGKGRFIVIQPVKGKNKNESTYHALKYGISDLENQGEQSQ